MEISELMIGDWVSSPILEHNGGGSYYHQIEEISIGYEYDAIPLTEEIININNLAYFRKTYDDDEWVVIIRQSSTWFTVDIAHTIDDRHDYSLDCFPISYVHELQHLLRLCGLSDLADNFKVK